MEASVELSTAIAFGSVELARCRARDTRPAARQDRAGLKFFFFADPFHHTPTPRLDERTSAGELIDTVVALVGDIHIPSVRTGGRVVDRDAFGVFEVAGGGAGGAEGGGEAVAFGGVCAGRWN